MIKSDQQSQKNNENVLENSQNTLLKNPFITVWTE
jgi:phosphoribosylformylglycinamidine (FGAM) synthase PurS component